MKNNITNYTFINSVALALFFISVVMIFIFKDYIKPLDEKIIYEYEKRIAEYLALPENRNMVNLDTLEKRFIGDYRDRNRLYELYLLGEDDDYSVYLQPESGYLELYTKKIKKMEDLISPETSMIIILCSEKGRYISYGYPEYFNPFTNEYEKSYFIKEKNDKKVVVSRICNSPNVWNREIKKLYPVAMTEDFYNDIIGQLKQIGQADLIEDLKTFYVFYDYNNNAKIPLNLSEELPFINIEKQKENFYYIRNVCVNNYCLINNIFEKLGYDEFDIRRMDKKFGYDEKYLTVCIMETTVDLTASPPQVSHKFIPISPRGVEYKLYEPLPKMTELKDLSDAEILELFFKAAEQHNYKLIDEIYPSNRLTDLEKNKFYSFFTYFKNLKIEKVEPWDNGVPAEDYNVFAVSYEAPHLNFLGYTPECRFSDNVPGRYIFSPDDYEKNGGTFHYDENEFFYVMKFDEEKGHWIILEVNISP